MSRGRYLVAVHAEGKTGQVLGPDLADQGVQAERLLANGAERIVAVEADSHYDARCRVRDQLATG